MASLSSKTPSSSGTTSYGATSYKTSTTTTSSNRNSRTNRQKRLSQDRDNQAYRLSSWNTSQLNVNTQPTIINSNMGSSKTSSSKTKTSSKNSSKINISKYNSQTNNYHTNHNNNLLSKTSLFKPKVGLTQSVGNKSLVNILKPGSKMNKSGMLGSKKPPDKKVYKIVVIRGITKKNGKIWNHRKLSKPELSKTMENWIEKCFISLLISKLHKITPPHTNLSSKRPKFSLFFDYHLLSSCMILETVINVSRTRKKRGTRNTQIVFNFLPLSSCFSLFFAFKLFSAVFPGVFAITVNTWTMNPVPCFSWFKAFMSDRQNEEVV